MNGALPKILRGNDCWIGSRPGFETLRGCCMICLKLNYWIKTSYLLCASAYNATVLRAYLPSTRRYWTSATTLPEMPTRPCNWKGSGWGWRIYRKHEKMVALTAGMLVDSQSPRTSQNSDAYWTGNHPHSGPGTVHQLFATLAGRALFRNVWIRGQAI